CCQLEPKDAELLHDVFSARSGTVGKTFGNLSTLSRCTLLSILDDRAARAGEETGSAARQEIDKEIRRAEEDAQERAEQERAAQEAQFQRDKELHDKAGRTTWFDVLLPGYAEIYRIPYAERIQHPVFRESARLAERTATMSIAGAIADPLTRPLKAVLSFIECMISSVKGRDVGDLAGRFGLKVAIMFPVVFPAGVIAGATKEIWNIAKQIASIIRHPLDFLKELDKFLRLLWAPDSSEIFCAMGQDMG